MLLCAVTSACVANDDDRSDTAEFRVQYDRMFNMFAVVPAPSGNSAEAQLARGAIHVAALEADESPMVAEDGTPVRYTCGAILVAPSYVITAGHCVSEEDILDPETTSVKLEMYPVEADLDWQSGMDLTTPGEWFDFEHDQLTGADGYHSEMYDCRVLQRCGTSWGTEIACNHPNADVALLRCDGRPGDKYGFVPVADTDIDGASVIMPWAHEVYDFDGFPGDDLLYDHYNKRNPVKENIHYMGGGRNQLLPLMSVGFWIGDLGYGNVKLAYENALGVRWTDLIGCHGTSGSPVLQWNAAMSRYEYLGPISRGHFLSSSVPGGMPETNQLCQEPDLHGPGQQNLAYSQLKYTQTVAENANDCSGLYDRGPLLHLRCILDDLVWEEPVWPWDLWQCLTCPPPWVKIAQIYDPMILLGTEEKLTTPLELAVGTKHRVSAIVVPSGEKAVTVTMFDAKGEALAKVEVAGDNTSFAVLQASVEGYPEQSLTFAVEGGEAFVTRIAAAPMDVANGFERMVDRVGVGVMLPDDKEGKAQAMRFAASGKDDFAAILRKGERMVLAREALPADVGLGLRFEAAGKGKLRAGFILADGTELVAEADAEKGSVALEFEAPKSTPIAVFIEGVDVEADVEIDDVLVEQH
jgi:hypothetical protein